MGFEEEVNLFFAGLEEAIDSAMEGEVADAGRTAISEAVKSEVYAAYTPSSYIRRGENGGLADKRNVFATYDPTLKELELQNITEDDESGKFIAPIVESGEGYTWVHSEIYQKQPFPRPFHSKAQEIMDSGAFEDALVKGLVSRGYDASR